MDFQIYSKRKIIKDNDKKYSKQSNYSVFLPEKSKRLYYSGFDRKILQIIKLFRKPFLFDKMACKEKIKYLKRIKSLIVNEINDDTAQVLNIFFVNILNYFNPLTPGVH